LPSPGSLTRWARPGHSDPSLWTQLGQELGGFTLKSGGQSSDWRSQCASRATSSTFSGSSSRRRTVAQPTSRTASSTCNGCPAAATRVPNRGPLAQWQSCGLLIRRLWVRVPRGPPNTQVRRLIARTQTSRGGVTGDMRGYMTSPVLDRAAVRVVCLQGLSGCATHRTPAHVEVPRLDTRLHSAVLTGGVPGSRPVATRHRPPRPRRWLTCQPCKGAVAMSRTVRVITVVLLAVLSLASATRVMGGE
jgi:hypothetical protein